MTIASFENQTPDAKFDSVYKEGFFMFRRSYFRRTVIVYALGDFFVKLTLMKETNEVAGVKAYSACTLPEHISNSIGKDRFIKEVPRPVVQTLVTGNKSAPLVTCLVAA